MKTYLKLMEIKQALVAGTIVTILLGIILLFAVLPIGIMLLITSVVFMILISVYNNKIKTIDNDPPVVNIADFEGINVDAPFVRTNEVKGYISVDDEKQMFYLWETMKLYRFEQLSCYKIHESTSADYSEKAKLSRSLFSRKKSRIRVNGNLKHYSENLGIGVTLLPNGEYVDLLFSKTKLQQNSLPYRQKKEELEKVKAMLDVILQSKKNSSRKKAASGKKRSGNGDYSAADEILKYKNLLDMGAITEEEYENKKRELL